MIDESRLDGVPLFRGLAGAARHELARRSTLRRLEPDAVLWLAGETAGALHVILEGEVRVVSGVGGRQHVVHVEGAGGTLGDVALFAAGPYPATAVASRRATCLVVPREALAAAVREDPELAFRIAARLAGRVRELIGRLDRATRDPVATRLTAYVLDRHAAAGGATFTLGATQQQVAEELGTVREVVVRTLGRLARRGVLRREGRGRYAVEDEAALRALAASRP